MYVCVCVYVHCVRALGVLEDGVTLVATVCVNIICICVCVCTYIVCVRWEFSRRVSQLLVLCVYIYIYMCVHMCVYLCIFAYLFVRICEYVYMEFSRMVSQLSGLCV